MWQHIDQAISEATGEAFTTVEARPVGGGCINDAVHLRGERHSYFVKQNQAQRLAMFEAEAAGLAAINASDSLRAPRAIAWGIDGGKSWLALEYISFGRPSADTPALLGERLAAMHRVSGRGFGWERDNTIGSTPQPNHWCADWVGFFAEHRLGFQLSLATQNGAPGELLKAGDELLHQLPRFFEDYQPAPSLLHGDLWGGNWGADEQGEPVIFDPAVYFGDRESDLAMTELFGGFDERFYQAYDTVWALDEGYPERRSLYQLYHVLNHFNLFGGGYASQASSLVNSLLNKGER